MLTAIKNVCNFLCDTEMKFEIPYVFYKNVLSKLNTEVKNDMFCYFFSKQLLSLSLLHTWKLNRKIVFWVKCDYKDKAMAFKRRFP